MIMILIMRMIITIIGLQGGPAGRGQEGRQGGAAEILAVMVMVVVTSIA